MRIRPLHVLALLAIAIAGFAYVRRPAPPQAAHVATTPASEHFVEERGTVEPVEPETPLPETPPAEASAFGFPLPRALERVSKKPFGLRIDKATSPVQPERFSGWHVGVDFETFEDEQGTDLEVFAICDGPLLLKRRATGYGGVAVQRCELDGRPVTVIYGHLDLASVTAAVGEPIARGAPIGVLGEAGAETDGERKHLHLGVHEGEAVDIRGYVQREADLKGWIDAREHFPR